MVGSLTRPQSLLATLSVAGHRPRFNWSKRWSSCSWLRMYSRITVPSRPTVDTKCPSAQKLCPTKLRLRSAYTGQPAAGLDRGRNAAVPCELAGQMASTRLHPGRVVVVANEPAVAGHERLRHIRFQTGRHASIGAGSRHPRSVARRVDKSKPDRSVHH